MSEVLQFQFRGIEEGADPKALPPGTLLTAENCAMDKARRLCKRAGTTSLVRTTHEGGTISSAVQLLTRGTDTVQLDSEHARTYSSERAKWHRVGRPPNLSVTRRGLVDSTRSVSQVDVLAYGNMLVTAMVTGYANLAAPFPSLYLQVEDLESGALVLPPTLVVTGAAWPRLHTFGTSVYFTCSDVNGAILIGEFSMTTLALVGGNSSIATGSVYAPCDSVLSSDGATMYFLYDLAAGASRLEVAAWTIATATLAMATVQYATGAAPVTAVSLALAPAGTTLHILYACDSSGTCILRTLSTSTLASSVGPTSISNGASSHCTHVNVLAYDSTRVLITVVGSDITGTVPRRLRTALRLAATHVEEAGSVRSTFHITAVARPFTLSSRWYALAVANPKDSSLTVNTPIPNATSVLVEIEFGDSLLSITGSPHVQAATLENLTGWFPTRIGTMPQVPIISGTAYVAAAYRNREPINFQSIPIGWNVYRVSVASSSGRLAIAGPSGLAAAGTPYWFDGTTAAPYGFATAPMILAVTAGGVGGAIAPGTYTYVAVYEWRDANGVLHRSPPSPPRANAVALVAGEVMTVTVATASLSQHQRPPYGTANANAANPVSVAIYRTTVGGSVYYRLTLEPEYQIVLNDPTAALGTVTLTDTKADADIGAGSPARPLSTQPQLYTASGEVEDIPPPAFHAVATHRGRLVGIGPDRRTVWFSKVSTEDALVAPGFNEALTLAFASDKYALASLDDKLVVFGETTIDVVYGEGPDATGLGGWQIQGIQTDVGCVNHKSVCAIPAGAVFESSRGFELLSRKLEVSWIGETIADTLAAFPTVTSATLVPDAREIRFTCTATGGATGIVLAWNYAYGVWFTRKYADLANTSAASIPFVDAALIDSVYTMLTAAGVIYKETTAHKLDNGTGFVGRDVVLAPISPAGNQSWHRVQQVSLLGTSVTNHDLTVSIASDYATSYSQTETFLAGSAATTIGPLEQCRITLAKQKCQAVKVRIQDVTPTSPGTYPVSTGDGPILEAVALRVGSKPGTPRTAAGQQR